MSGTVIELSAMFVAKMTCQNQSVNQSLSKSTDQSINQSTDQSMNQSVKLSINQSSYYTSNCTAVTFAVKKDILSISHFHIFNLIVFLLLSRIHLFKIIYFFYCFSIVLQGLTEYHSL